jgi:hypothetical protein
MPDRLSHATRYPEVNAVLGLLLSGVRTVLGSRFVGMYVHGSAASDDLDAGRSDIDFVVVTADELPDEMLADLERMHARITTSGMKWAKKLEGSYIPLHALRRYDPADTRYPALRVDGSFCIDEHGSDWVIQRHIIREQGIVVAGPAPQSLIDPVMPTDLRRAVVATLREWWSPQLRDPVRLYSREYQAYAVLTMCRALYTLQHGQVVSKPIAARWGQEVFGERWEALIERALAWPSGSQPDSLDETLDFIRFALERVQQFENAMDEASAS